MDAILDAVGKHGWLAHHPRELYHRYLDEQSKGELLVLVAFAKEDFVGYLTIRWMSKYRPFRDEDIPEIMDFNVFPEFRRRRIGTRLMDEAEGQISERSPIAGIGVGLTSDYGAAQRLYVERGYKPDGRGVVGDGRSPLDPSDSAPLHRLVLFFTKQLDHD